MRIGCSSSRRPQREGSCEDRARSASRRTTITGAAHRFALCDRLSDSLLCSPMSFLIPVFCLPVFVLARLVMSLSFRLCLSGIPVIFFVAFLCPFSSFAHGIVELVSGFPPPDPLSRSRSSSLTQARSACRNERRVKGESASPRWRPPGIRQIVAGGTVPGGVRRSG